MAINRGLFQFRTGQGGMAVRADDANHVGLVTLRLTVYSYSRVAAILYAFRIAQQGMKSRDTSGLQADTQSYVSADIRRVTGRVIRHMALQKVVSP